MTHLNPETKVINPELVKAAAEMAIPGIDWFVCQHSSRAIRHRQGLGGRFDPLFSRDDSWSLEDALIKVGWSFRWLPISRTFLANHKPWGCDSVTICPEADDSRALLLLKCVSAQTGIKMYGE